MSAPRRALGSLSAWRELPPSQRLGVGAELEEALRSAGYELEGETRGDEDLLVFRHRVADASFVCVPGGACARGVGDPELAALAGVMGPSTDPLLAAWRERASPRQTGNLAPFLCAVHPVLATSSSLPPDLAPDAERPYFGEGPVPEHLTGEETMRLLASLGGELRLLSESEWEYVAREGSDSQWLVGRGGTRAAMEAELESLYQDARYTPSRADGQNRFGCWGMVYGEWVADAWHDSYEGAPTDGAAWGDARPPIVIRGGAASMYPFQDDSGLLACHVAYRERADFEGVTAGVRLAADLPSSFHED